jgi:atypical dual specificity phosphatase
LKKIISYESPRNFSFITDNVSGSSIPDNEEHIEFFNKIGIELIITLMENPLEKNLQAQMKFFNIDNEHFHVVDREPMNNDQMINIVKLINSYNKVVIHCRGGVGRTATALIAYLITLGKSREESTKILERRKTILSKSQEEFLKNWKSSVVSGLIDFKSNIKIVSKMKLPPLIMLVGLPASGKTTFSTIIMNQIKGIERINQDEIRIKGKCEELFSKLTKGKGTVILDRCNQTKEERKYWLSLNNSSEKNVWCIFFNCSPEECKWRIKNRKDHPTVKAEQGERIVDNVAKTLEEPTLNEGFTKIDIITSFKESNDLLMKIGCDISELTEVNHDDIIKFPRTKHLFNLGAASRDDLIMSADEVSGFLNCDIYVEEKIDGANMGISIKDYKIVVQNRSHYVDSSYHPQFKLLEKWINDHERELWDILNGGTRILYGEWTYAKHSIEYSDLPDYFIAFDLYDLIEKRFYSRNRLEDILSSTQIKLIPIIKYDKFKSIQDIVSLVKTKSSFYDGSIEGLYVRKCSKDWLEDRAKIVRNDFICGNNHWTKNIMIVNKLHHK